jgi:hypothetical protein
MRVLATSALAVSVAMLATSLLETPRAAAQVPSACGSPVYSIEHQRHVVLPCTPDTSKAENGKSAPCGTAAYSVGDQQHVVLPCALPAPQTEAERPTP